MNNEIDKKIEELLKESGKSSLSASEKTAMRFAVQDFIKKNPIGTTASVTQRLKAIYEKTLSATHSFSKNPSFVYRFSVLLLFVTLGSGMSYAANHALPADLLYPVKEAVNEKVLGYTMFSD